MLTDEYPVERRHFRIIFPQRERPRLVESDGTRHVVVDCSECGVRYRPQGEAMPELGATVAGVIHFRGGRKLAISGSVVRLYEGEVGVQLDATGIPFPALWAEQRRLRRRAAVADDAVAG